jgi:thiol-disulfide isomerase/thioredoxin
MTMISMTIASMLFQSISVSSLELNVTTYNELLLEAKSTKKRRKNGMINFYQPYCGHCLRLKPFWDQLEEEFDGHHPTVFVGSVNCEQEKALCAEHHTGGQYPTILIFRDEGDNQPMKQELYDGGRNLEDLLKFVDNELVRPCELGNIQQTCTEKEIKYISKWSDRGMDRWKEEIGRLRGMDNGVMTYQTKRWLDNRLKILDQFQTGKFSKEKVDDEL